MGDILTFALRPQSVPPTPEPLSAEAVRAHLEEIGQAALDLIESVRAVLDAEDGDPNLEDGADTEPSLAAPENHHASQVGWCRGNDGDREAEAPEVVLPEVTVTSPVPKLRPVLPASMPWGGDGNVVSACAALLLALTVGR